jgi:acyl dehydratase
MRQELRHWAKQALGIVERFEIGFIDPISTQRYAVAVDERNLLYFDREYARSLGYRDIIAPPNYLATLRGSLQPGPFDADLLHDGMSPSARPPLPSLKAMGGGQRLTLHAPVYCGDFIAGQRRLAGVTEKKGRADTLIVIEEELAYADKAGELKLTLRNTLLCIWIDRVA